MGKRNNQGFLPLVALVFAGVALVTGTVVAFKIKQALPAPVNSPAPTATAVPTAYPAAPVTLNLTQNQGSTLSVSLATRNQKISGFQIYLDAKFAVTPPEINVTPTAREMSYILAESKINKQTKTAQIAIAAFSTNGISLESPLEVAKISIPADLQIEISANEKLTKITSFETGETLPLSTSGLVIAY